MATTKVSFETTSMGSEGSVNNPTFDYSIINFLPNNLASQEDQLEVLLTRQGSSTSTVLQNGPSYTLNTTTKKVTLQNAVNLQVGDIVTVKRSTDIDNRLTDFTGLAFLDAEAVDNDGDNLLHLIQELDTGISDSIRKATNGLSWDAQGLPITNGSAATTGNSFTTLSQVNGLISGADIATVGNSFAKEFTGDGTTTDFNLTNFPTADVEPERLIVSVDGITQLPTTDYDYTLVNSVPTVSFVTAPPNGSAGFARTFDGVVQASFGEDTINGSAILPGTLNVDSLTAGSGLTNRWLKFDNFGVPSAETLQVQEITNFDTGVENRTLNSFQKPDDSISMDNNKITNLATGASGSTDACNVAQMETFTQNNSGVAGSIRGIVFADDMTDTFDSFSGFYLIQRTATLSTGPGTFLIFINGGVPDSPVTTLTAGGQNVFEVGNPLFVTTTQSNIAVTATTEAGLNRPVITLGRVLYMRIE